MADVYLKRNETLDQKLLDDYQERVQNNLKHKDMQAFRKKLPSFEMQEVNLQWHASSLKLTVHRNFTIQCQD